MNYDTYIEDIEALPNFGGWVIYDLEGTILEEFEVYDEMIEVYDYSYKSSDVVPGYQVNNELKAGKIYR